MTRLYYWIHHTGSYDGNTGVQRVVRNLAAALAELSHVTGGPGAELVLVRWCPEREAIIHAEAAWATGLGRFGGPVLAAGPDQGQPLHLSDAGRMAGAWLLLPEVPHVAGESGPNLAVVLDYARFHGLRTAAVFYDIIPLRRSGYEAMAGDHARYARALAGADLLLGISRHAAQDLQAWWAEQGYDGLGMPRVLALPLPEEMRGTPRALQPADPPAPPVCFLALGTVEPRKNQLAVMRAFARLAGRRPDLALQFDIVGGLHAAVADEATALAAATPNLRLHGYLPDAAVRPLVEAAHATVFLSLDEGYGLPVAESLWRGRPCLCSDHGAVAEIAAGGGCLAVDARDPAAIERGLEQLADDPALRRRLAAEACTRPLRRWRDYGAAVLGALAAMPPTARLAVLEGSRGGDAIAARLAAEGVVLRRLHWRADSRALLPGSAAAPEPPRPGDGQLKDLRAILPAETCADAAEAREILEAGRGLGLWLALEAGTEVPVGLAAAADLALFPTAAQRDAALATALRELPRTVGVRERFRTGTGTAALAAIAADRPRLTAAGAPQTPRRVFYWVGLTITQPFNTGVQRVTRLLAAALERLGVEVVPVKWDATAGAMVQISAEESAHLARWGGPAARPPRALPASLAGEWLVVPEITVLETPPGVTLPQFGQALGMRVAEIFYDLIPLRMGADFPAEALLPLHPYWRTFGQADLALPISWTVAADLRRYLAETGARAPAMVPCPLAGEIPAAPRVTQPRPVPAAGEPLQLVAIGTWEPRKNYPRLLRALAAAQRSATRPIRLTIVGRRADYAALDAEIQALAEQTGTRLGDHVSDAELLALLDAASATVFASWDEGFGLPVLESLWRGLPCLCHTGSAMAEVAPGGGTLAVDMLDEAAIAEGLRRLADEPLLLARLGQEAVTRPIRDWDEYAEDVLRALARAGAAPGWPLPAIARRRPLLTCAITTYNRAPWLSHSLPRLLEATRPWRDVVEVVVCDNASTDDTPAVVARSRGEANFQGHRNRENVGMLGNLGATARLSRGAFVWLLGDDDLLLDGAIENILEGLARHPEVEMAYMNYAYTHFDAPGQLAELGDLVAAATPIAPGGPNRRVDALREVAGLNENLFTAIYACAFRRDHALRAYQLDTSGAPFSSLATCVPSSVYALAALQDRPAWWVGEPAMVVNMNVSWLRWVLLWHLERMPDLFEAAEAQGIDPARLDRYRLQHLTEAERWVRMTYFEADDTIRGNFSLARLLERCKHLPEFRERHLPGVKQAYADAFAAGRVLVDAVPPNELFSRYGLG